MKFDLENFSYATVIGKSELVIFRLATGKNLERKKKVGCRPLVVLASSEIFK